MRAVKGESRFSKSRPAQVLVVDDQALYREGLREIMGHWPEFKVIGEAADGWHALSFCRKRCPDLVVMDNMMPMMNGVEAARRILKEYPHVIIVMLTVFVDEKVLLKAFDAGVSGYVLKETPSKQIRAHLRDAVRGDTVVSASVARFLVSEIASRPNIRVEAEQLPSDAEFGDEDRALMKLLAQGLSNEAIGAALFISPGLVKKRLKAIMDKLSLDNRVQVAVYAVRNGIAD